MQRLGCKCTKIGLHDQILHKAVNINYLQHLLHLHTIIPVVINSRSSFSYFMVMLSLVIGHRIDFPSSTFRGKTTDGENKSKTENRKAGTTFIYLLHG